MKAERNKKDKGEKKGWGLLRRWLSDSDREALAVDATVTLAFTGLMALIIGLFVVLSRLESVQLESEIERRFNNIALDIQQDNILTQPTLSDNTLGIGVYDSSGSLVAGWGSVYNTLPVASIAAATSESGSASMIKFDSSTNVMEYVRFLRQPILFDGASFYSSGLTGGAVRDTSLILYLAFDGSAHMGRRNLLLFVAVLAAVGVALLYVFVMRINRQNRAYKEEMVKQANLVNLGQAARTLTHEIKNPLSAITIQIALLKRQLKESDLLEEVELIEGETKRLIQLTNRVSDFLRNPEGQPEQIDVSALIDKLIPLFPYPIKVLETGERHAYILFDPDRLRSVVENILKNACESCEGRDPQVEVEIVSGRKGMWHIYVRDRGDGIKGDTEKLFDPFYTTKIHGSGIGLSISRQFLRARGGDIRLSPRPGGGTVVELTIAKYSLVQDLVVQGNAKRRKIK